ncbi:MAG: 50S ribosomal protein L24 [bacterium]|nr:50S ribosomal protein L24 [bacterium]
MKLKTGDTVTITSGKEKGKKGKITKVFPQGLKVIVEGVNIKKRHRKPTKSGEKGQIIEKQNPIALGNVRLICVKCNKATRAGYKMEGTNKTRVCKKCGQET